VNIGLSDLAESSEEGSGQKKRGCFTDEDGSQKYFYRSLRLTIESFSR
jgi:hypothetical protein